MTKTENFCDFLHQMNHWSNSDNNLNFGGKVRSFNICSSPAFLQFLFPALTSTSPMLSQDCVSSSNKIDTYVVWHSNKCFLIQHTYLNCKKSVGILRSYGEPAQQTFSVKKKKYILWCELKFFFDFFLNFLEPLFWWWRISYQNFDGNQPAKLKKKSEAHREDMWLDQYSYVVLYSSKYYSENTPPGFLKEPKYQKIQINSQNIQFM